MNFDQRVARLIRENTGVCYARTTVSSHSFDMQEDLYCFRPTVYPHREWAEMERLARTFLDAPADRPMLLYIYSHAYVQMKGVPQNVRISDNNLMQNT